MTATSSPATPIVTSPRRHACTELLDERGRTRDSFGTDMFVDYAQGPDEWHDRAHRWEAAGGRLMSMRSMTTGTDFLGVPGADLSGPAEHIAALERFMAEMAPR